jgi:hypothetical protein
VTGRSSTPEMVYKRCTAGAPRVDLAGYSPVSGQSGRRGEEPDA